MELISVIIPVYNVEKYLRKCLDSVIAQTYKQLEVIMVDDGSTDSCGKICDEYAQNHENFIVIHKENAGLGMARNTGLEHISGKYVMFLDSDDYISSDLIETLYNALKTNKVDISKSGFNRVDDNGNMLSERRYNFEVFEGKKAATVFLPRLIGSSPEKKDSFEMSVWASLYNTEYIKKNHILFPSERDLISEDMIFNIEYTQYANGACVISKMGYNYRYNPGSLTKSYRSNKYEACIKFHIYVKNRLKELGYNCETQYRLDRIFFVNIRGCIAQETNSNNGFTFKQRIDHIRKICMDDTLQNTIDEYPIKKLGFVQRIFLYMLKHKLCLLLYSYFLITKNN